MRLDGINMRYFLLTFSNVRLEKLFERAFFGSGIQRNDDTVMYFARWGLGLRATMMFFDNMSLLGVFPYLVCFRALSFAVQLLKEGKCDKHRIRTILIVSARLLLTFVVSALTSEGQGGMLSRLQPGHALPWLRAIVTAALQLVLAVVLRLKFIYQLPVNLACSSWSIAVVLFCTPIQSTSVCPGSGHPIRQGVHMSTLLAGVHAIFGVLLPCTIVWLQEVTMRRRFIERHHNRNNRISFIKRYLRICYRDLHKSMEVGWDASKMAGCPLTKHKGGLYHSPYSYRYHLLKREGAVLKMKMQLQS